MKRAFLLGAVAFLGLCAFALSTGWKLAEPEKVVVNFALKQDGTKGTFKGMEATINFDESDLAKSSIKATIKVKSLSTQNAKRDEHLMGSEFFDQEKYPTISFASSEITKTKNGFSAKGKLTMKGKTNDVTVPFTFSKDKDGGAILKGTMDVNPSKYGVLSGEKRKDETASISVEVKLKK